MRGTPDVEERVAEALRLIESAQNDLARAAACLSPIANGGMLLWQRVSRMHGQVHRLWYMLHNKDRRRWALDGRNAGHPFNPGSP
jgi:hypothetical protein